MATAAQHPVAPAETHRQALTGWARWGVAHRAEIHYSEVNRSAWLHSPAGTLPVWTDCSGFVTMCAKWAGLSDPNGLGYSQVGYTGTLLHHCNHIAQKQALPGDLIVYGPGTGHHVVVIVTRLEDGKDFECVSHGSEPDPSLVKHSVEAARQPPGVTFLRWLSP